MRKLLYLALLMALFSGGCGKDDVEKRHDAQVESLMKQLSVREKVAQLIVLTISREPSEETVAHQDSLVRDARLQKRIERALHRSSQPEIIPLDGDRTLILDKGGK